MTSRRETPISPLTASRPELTPSAAAINDVPVELDSTPISSEHARFDRRGSKAAVLEALHADKSLSRAEREEREKLMKERKTDPAVLVDVPKGPAAAELERASSERPDGADGTSDGRDNKA